MNWTTVPNGGTVSANWTGDLRFDYNGGTVAYNNATAVITLEGVVADDKDDIFTDGNSTPKPWHNLLNTHLSNGGSVITIEGINQPSNYSSAIQLTNTTVPSVSGTYTISVVVDADGPGTEYLPSEPATITLTVE